MIETIWYMYVNISFGKNTIGEIMEKQVKRQIVQTLHKPLHKSNL